MGNAAATVPVQCRHAHEIATLVTVKWPPATFSAMPSRLAVPGVPPGFRATYKSLDLPQALLGLQAARETPLAALLLLHAERRSAHERREGRCRTGPVHDRQDRRCQRPICQFISVAKRS
jgi:hypothetical protein